MENHGILHNSAFFMDHGQFHGKSHSRECELRLKKVKVTKDVNLYSAFHAPGTPNAHTLLKLTRQTAI